MTFALFSRRRASRGQARSAGKGILPPGVEPRWPGCRPGMRLPPVARVGGPRGIGCPGVNFPQRMGEKAPDCRECWCGINVKLIVD